MRALLSSLLAGLVLLHRYLGVGIGAIMTLWCLSGFVMMYQDFPGTTQAEQMAALAPLDPAACCDASAVRGPAAADNFRVEMLAGRPALRLGGRGGAPLDLASGQPVAIGEAEVRRIAEDFARGNGIAGRIAKTERIRVDQWSVGVFKREPVLWKVSFDGPAQEWLYVSGRSGVVVQDASQKERLLGWIGAVPHWLYPTLLRQDGPLWTQVVIWASVIGVFLTVTGIVVGLPKLRGRSGRWWPYRRPMWLWHHMFGVFAGLFVLTWVVSGLMTMQPWGLFETQPTFRREALGGRMSWAEARALIEQGPAMARGGTLVQIRAAPLLGEARALAVLRDGESVRYGAEGPAPVDIAALRTRFASAPGVLATAQVELMTREDSYYYGHKAPVALPVLRAVLNDGDGTRIYIDPQRGEVLRVADGTSQRYRWLDNGMHTLDLPVLRLRPLWDVVTLTLLAAVTVSCATGTWLGFTRIGRDVGRLRGWLARRRG